jgi:plasmid stabilization system protein ParE
MRVAILKLARNDLREINEYLSEFGENPPRKFRESFQKFTAQVADKPFIFGKYENNPIYRRAVISYEYLVFYQVDEKKRIVKVYRVLHGKRNIVPLLDETIPD